MAQLPSARRRRRWRPIALALLSLPALAIAASAAFGKPRASVKHRVAGRADARHAAPSGGPGRAEETERLQSIADAVRTRLGVERAVTVALVDSNPYLVSVEAPPGADQPFVLRIESRMLQLLSGDELEAVVAHELGHVWIFTHHPYLQTELLANQVAMRAVPRDALARVYQKVWKGGPKGDLVAFLGNVDPR